MRGLYLWQIREAPFFDLRLGDGAAYHDWARRIAGGDWLGEGVFYQSPLYPYFLAVLYRLVDDSAATVRIVHAVISAASCSLVAAAGMSILGLRGAIAGLALAIYPPAIFLDSLIDKTGLATFLVTALLAFVAGRRWLAAGAALGLLGLTRESALVWAAPILLWIAWEDSRRLRAAAAFAAGSLLILLPVGLRNLAMGGEFHLTTSQFGPNFYIGNHAGAPGSYQPLIQGHGSAADEREDATRLAEQAAGRKLTPGDVSRYWTARALTFVRAQPGEWLQLTARKLALVFNAAEVTDTESQDVYAEWSWLLRGLLWFDFGILAGLAALGIVLTAGSSRSLRLVYALAGVYAISTALFFVVARYRLPLALVLMIPAAAGVAHAWTRIRERRYRALAVAAAVAAVIFAASRLPLEDSRKSRATHYTNVAVALSRDSSKMDVAAEMYRRALDADRTFPAARHGKGLLLAKAGRHEEAIPHYRAAVAEWSEYAEARYNLAAALAATGRPEEAAREYAEALRTRSDDIDTRLALARTLLTLNRPSEAEKHYRVVLALHAEESRALVGLGVVLARSGRVDEAIRHFRMALEADPQNASAHNNLGSALANQGRMAEAAGHFEKAVALNPADESARRNLEQAQRVSKPDR